MSTISQGPPLYIETKSAFVEEEKKSRRRKQFFGKLWLGMKWDPDVMVRR